MTNPLKTIWAIPDFDPIQPLVQHVLYHIRIDSPHLGMRPPNSCLTDDNIDFRLRMGGENFHYNFRSNHKKTADGYICYHTAIGCRYSWLHFWFPKLGRRYRWSNKLRAYFVIHNSWKIKEIQFLFFYRINLFAPVYVRMTFNIENNWFRSPSSNLKIFLLFKYIKIQ